MSEDLDEELSSDEGTETDADSVVAELRRMLMEEMDGLQEEKMKDLKERLEQQFKLKENIIAQNAFRSEIRRLIQRGRKMTEVDNRVLGDMETQVQEFVFRLRTFLADPNKDLHQKQRAFTVDSQKKIEDPHVRDSEVCERLKAIEAGNQRERIVNRTYWMISGTLFNTGVMVAITPMLATPYAMCAVSLVLVSGGCTINQMAENARNDPNRS